MAKPTKREPEQCSCGQYPTDDNWREHYEHWIEATARRLLAQGKKPGDVGTAFQPAMARIVADQSYYRTGIYPPVPAPVAAAPVAAATWTARTENTLAQVLCRLAEGDQAAGICGAHLHEARVALAHLANIGALKTPNPN